VDLVLVGLPGSGKSAVGRRLAGRHGATFIDLDEIIEREAGATVAEIFAAEGEAGFRARERAVVAGLGPADTGPGLARVISPGGGAVVDPRNRWTLYRGRVAVWLNARPEVLAQRLRRSPNVRPLVQGRDPLGTIRELARARAPFYGAANQVNGVAEVGTVIAAVERLVAQAAVGGPGLPTILLRAETPIGLIVIGEGVAATGVSEALRKLEAPRAVLISEPAAWAAFGAGVGERLAAEGWAVDHLLLPEGEDAKRLQTIEDAARELARMRVERREPLVAIGGGALGDPAGFLAATYLRGVPWIGLPTTLVAQVDSSIGGKTGVDLPEGKNLVGAFHQPSAIVLDVAALRTLPERQLRAALGECVKMAVLGDERLFAVLEAEGEAVARGAAEAFEGGAIAEIVERSAWAKVQVVSADEREQGAEGGRITLNLGHTIGHGLEAADGYAHLLHGEAVAFGLRAAVRIGQAMGVTPVARAARVEGLLDRLALGQGALPYPAEAVLDAMGTDKKVAGGRIRWVLPTAEGVVVRNDVPVEMVRAVLDGILAGDPAPAIADGGA